MKDSEPNVSHDSTQLTSSIPARDQSSGDVEAALWAGFAQASTREAFCASWLALQCCIIGGVSGGVVLWKTTDSESFFPLAVWPSAQVNMSYLTEAAERAAKERRGLVLKRNLDGDNGDSELTRFEVAFPVEVAGHLYGVVVLDVPPRPEPQLQAVLRQLQWGFAWLEVMVRGEEDRKESSSKERTQTVLDLIAATVEHERFQAAMAFVTAMATRLDCDRVSVGFVCRGRAHVRAVSHTAEFGKQTNLVRAIGSAMDEALEQQRTVVYPAPRDGAARVTRAHAELARQHGSGAICTIPLSYGDRLVGALTLERPADRPFDPPTVELCEGAAALAGPVLEIQRRDDRLVADMPDDRLIDWFGNINDFVVPGPGYGGPTIVRSPSPWVRDFLLKLAAADGALDPNREIALVIPGSPDQQGNSGKGGRTK